MEAMAVTFTTASQRAKGLFEQEDSQK